ncbi:hypothetical protein LSAT2_018497, partial [Lamellibrachia satsuma]
RDATSALILISDIDVRRRSACARTSLTRLPRSNGRQHRVVVACCVVYRSPRADQRCYAVRQGDRLFGCRLDPREPL